MYETVRMSKYNFTAYDDENNLIVYNFLRGLSSLTKITKSDVDKFKSLFMKRTVIYQSDCEKYMEAVGRLIESGILIDTDMDEGILYDSKYYEEIYNKKLSLVILPTGRCNLKCSYCLEAEQTFFRGKMTVKAQDAILKFVQRHIRDYNELQVSWFGGEPLLESQIIKYLSENFIKICNARFIPYSAQTTTNGVFLNSDIFDMMYKQKVFNYMITLDGFKEQHDKLRCTHNGAGTYDTIIENLLKIRDSKQYRFARIIIRINITRNLLNVLDEFITYIDSMFGNDSRFTFLFIPVENYSNVNTSDNDMFISHDELMSHLLNNALYKSKFYSEELKKYLIEPGQGCVSSLKNSYTIAPDLKVYKCCAHYDLSENNIGYIDLNGNLVLDEVLHSKWYLVNEFIKRLSDSCRDCYYMPACTNNGKNCPYQYLKRPSKPIFCPLKNDNFVNALTETVLYAAKRYCCQTISL